MTGTKVPISILASNLANQLGRIVLDKTDLKGDYDFTFEWATLDLASPGAFGRSVAFYGFDGTTWTSPGVSKRKAQWRCW